MPLNEITPANESNLTRIRRAAGAVWQWLRGFTGDTSYEGYLRHASECSGKQLTAEEFYLRYRAQIHAPEPLLLTRLSSSEFPHA